MEDIINFLILIQMAASFFGACYIARKVNKIEEALSLASFFALILPFILYIIPYSQNPTLEKMTFFIEWMIKSAVANEIAAIPTVLLMKFRKR